MAKITWQVAGLTDCGLARKHNEDNYSISDDTRLFVVADGMGGTENGALASKLAVEEMTDYRQANQIDLEDPEAIKAWLTTSIGQANRRVNDEQARIQLQMGTTIVAAVQSDDGRLHIAHVGDSRAYLVREGVPKILTDDHSVVMEMFKSGKLTKEQLQYSPFKHLITRCLGHGVEVESDYNPLETQPGDWVIMATDGLSAVIDEEELAAIIQLSENPSQACKELVDRTIAGGAPDNVTVIVLQYQGEDSQPANGKTAPSAVGQKAQC
jgi:PPM family protein phosphatase